MRYLLILFCIAIALLAGVLIASTAYSHTVGNVDYSHWVRPGGGSCCGNQDCAPVPPGFIRREADNTFSVYRYGVWTHFPAESIMSWASPDAQVHACMSVQVGYAYEHGEGFQGHIAYCLVLPGGY